jgi:hypothetical protein
MAKAFCDTIAAADYEPMIYFGRSQSMEMMKLEELVDYPFWLAMYSTVMDYPYKIDMWQYTDAGTVPGIAGNVDMNLMFTYDAAGKVTGAIVNVPCPSQVVENFYKQSADYWHDVRQLVKETFGEDVMVMPQCAFAGDLSPRILHYNKAQARRFGLKYNMGYEPGNTPGGSQGDYNKRMAERKDIAERILLAVKDIYSWASKEIYTEPELRHKMEKLQKSVIEWKRVAEEDRSEMKMQIAKLGRKVELMAPFMCGDLTCKLRQRVVISDEGVVKKARQKKDIEPINHDEL